ncbi:S-layer homology domain-containing protein [Paenibacillus sp. IB182496]|uniref:S-layer homology domain-containing protein n=1 Tax=Paenibacillus sabuli TaxID=2772509 RepID=A0A927BX86_9BACL|nr:S-layer homology domain-containing protein [Paenibacillus sabuli]MBD2847566.1 S-layer homology domain-containing protein [Paenibacillus sabuli]
MKSLNEVNEEMNWKSKIAASTLAASLAATAFAGLPLSTKGLAEKAGLAAGIAAAAETPFADTSFSAKLERVYAELDHAAYADAAAAVADLRGAIDTLTTAERDAIIDPVWNKVQGKIDDPADRDKAQAALRELLPLIFGALYDEDLSSLDAIHEEDIQEGLDILAAAAALDAAGDEPVVGTADVNAFLEAIEATTIDEISSLANVLALVSGEGRLQLVKDIILDVRGADNAISRILAGLDDNGDPSGNVTADDIADAYTAFVETEGIEAHYNTATKAMIAAYVRSESTATYTSSNGGLTRAYETLHLFDIALPAGMNGITWTWSNTANINGGVTNGKLVLSSSSRQTTELVATIAGQDVYRETITLSGSGSGGGAPYVPVPTTPGTDVTQVVSAIKGELANLVGALDSAADADALAELVRQAIDGVKTAVDQLAQLDVSGDVSIADGKATVKLSALAVKEAIDAIRDVLDELDSLVAGASSGLASPIRIELGEVDAAELAVEVPDGLFAAAAAAGLPGIVFAAGGAEVTVPASSDFTGGEVRLSIGTRDAAEEPALTAMTAVSQVYDFGLTTGGGPVMSFVTPVQIKMPLDLGPGTDNELLTTVKLLPDGTLESHGGFVRGQQMVESRDSFSSYAVVEGHVAFDDTAPVDEWAGRAIQVMAAKGAIDGRAEGVYAPGDHVTRAEFAKILVRALNLENRSASESFGDVAASDWYGQYVAAASELGIINGRSADTFAPHANITRAELATMLARAVQDFMGITTITGAEKALAAYADADAIHPTLREGVAFATDQGLVTGYGGSFHPNDYATRAEAAVMAYRAFKLVE